MSKFNQMSQLFKDTNKQITSSGEEWTKFLKSACNVYKYSFMEQIMIYAQNPNAMAVASMNVWNKRMHCWVNRGAKGIALLDSDNKESNKLKYVFDISSVHKEEYIGRYPLIWVMHEEHEASIIDKLSDVYDIDFKPMTTFEDKIIELSKYVVEFEIDDILENLNYVKENSRLRDYSKEDIAVRTKELLSASVSYMLLCRCGYQDNGLENVFDFSEICNFNTIETLDVLGESASELSKQILVQIAGFIQSYNKKMGIYENMVEKTYSVHYNKDRNNTTFSAGGKEYEDGLYTERRISDTEHSSGSGERRDNNEVGTDEENMAASKSEVEIQLMADGGSSENEVTRNSGESREDVRYVSGSNDGKRRDNGTAQEREPNALGAGSEQYPSESGGDSEERSDLHRGLTKNEPAFVQLSLFPSFNEQSGIIAAAVAKEENTLHTTAAFVSEDIIKSILKKQARNDYHNERAILFYRYMLGDSAENITDEIKTIFNGHSFGFVLEEGTKITATYDEAGININYGTTGYGKNSVCLSYDEVYNKIGELITQGEYIDEFEVGIARGFYLSKLSEKLLFFYRDCSSAKPEYFDNLRYFYPDNIDMMRDLLENQREDIIKFMDMASENFYQGNVSERFTKLYNDLLLLNNAEKEYVGKESVKNLVTECFITQDTIDSVLREGSEIENGKVRIYEQFIKGESAKDNISFLKHEYGIGGRGYKGFDQEHDGKGIKISTGNILNPLAKVILPYSVVEKRLSELIKQEKYLTAEEAEIYNNNKVIDSSKKENSNVEIESFQPAAQNVFYPGNYHIQNELLGQGTLREKFNYNVSAIEVLKQLENENDRKATSDEQNILAKYVGWGGLADVFDKEKKAWNDEYKKLKELLSDSEYSSARASTLNAHYTSPVIIKEMYAALEKMGFVKGNVLEPAVAIGNFFGMLPDKMSDSKLYGVELDSISGRIAKKLYPEANITVSGFEKSNFSNDFFDVAIGNVPFGNYRVNDREYNRENFLIHDYFFAKTIDKVRTGGIIAFITSKGTLDKKDTTVRKYLAERTELLGAVRLPNTAFKANAGTEVTSDIIFLKKRDSLAYDELEWLNVSPNEEGILINNYFISNPDMIIGKMKEVSGPFGMESTCEYNGNEKSFENALHNAIQNIDGEIEELDLNDERYKDNNLNAEILSSEPDIANFSHTIVNGKIYYRENSAMFPVNFPENQIDRVKSLIVLRNTAYELIDYQVENYSDEDILEKQQELNILYDEFSEKYGLLNSNINKKIFNDDAGYPMLCSLEEIDSEGKLLKKSDIFTKRTIKKAEPVTHVDTASEALTLSMSEKGRVDFDYMQELSGMSEENIIKELQGIIFKNPITERFEEASEYLSGNIREKLKIAKEFVTNDKSYEINVSCLEKVMPKPLEAADIEVRLGATWLKPKVIEQFISDILKPATYYLKWGSIKVNYSDVSGEWRITGKSVDSANPLVNSTYGTSRINAYKILENSLNLKDSRVYDIIDNGDGSTTRKLNQKETAIASQKQDVLKEAFKEWIFQDRDRRIEIVNTYNELFNSVRPREYNGSNLSFKGMNILITLKDYQKNAVARMLYGNNTLLGHCVGAGKTYTMITAAMESKRLGMCKKCLFVVPNHLTGDWGSDFLYLYPRARILVATENDFTPTNRKRFCSRIATGDYDAVIIGHSQFERIPISIERQLHNIKLQIEEIETAIENEKRATGEKFTIKQMEKTRKMLKTKLEKLNDSSKKDNTVTFEQLGIDRLFIDESHYYKNLYLYTKMRNVSGVSQSEAAKSSDMLTKCMYLDELTDGKGIVFATGTPISNFLTELYINMKYLLKDRLKELHLDTFDAWAATFAEQTTEMELAPEGTGYRLKTRLARFFNLPELINLFKECADIQTADMLNLPVPKAEYKDIILEPTEFQKEMITKLGERADAVRNGLVDPKEDNMLSITNDGRFLALDERMINPDLPDTDNSKASACAKNAYNIWENTKDKRSTQLIFCDVSTPQSNGGFSIYTDIKEKLVAMGVPKEEIAFIHEANTKKQKSDLFSKVRKGKVRFLFGSTQKMGAGTNVQDKLIALHHLDVPWRPSDIEQQEGRILRQGNENEKVQIFRYIKKGTFDSYSWQVIEKKQRFISQIYTSKAPVRSADDIDEVTLNYAEVKALATGNPKIKEKMELDVELQRLKLLRSSYFNQKFKLEDDIAVTFPLKIKSKKEYISGLTKDVETAKDNEFKQDEFLMKIGNISYSDKKEVAVVLLQVIKEKGNSKDYINIGEYKGFKMLVAYDFYSQMHILNLQGSISHKFNTSEDALGNITRINNAIERMETQLEEEKLKLEKLENDLDTAKAEVDKPFPKEQEFIEKSKKLKKLEAELDMDANQTGNFNDKAGELADKIDQLIYDYDTYDYNDKVEDREANVLEIRNSIINNDIDSIEHILKDISRTCEYEEIRSAAEDILVDLQDIKEQQVENGKEDVSMDEDKIKVIEKNVSKSKETVEKITELKNTEGVLLEPGDIFLYEGKQWIVRKNDGFMLSAENLDKNDKEPFIDWIGRIENHDYVLISKHQEELETEQQEVEEPVVNVSDKVLADPLFKLNSSNVQKTDEVEETIEEKEKEEKRLARPMENKTI